MLKMKDRIKTLELHRKRLEMNPDLQITITTTLSNHEKIEIIANTEKEAKDKIKKIYDEERQIQYQKYRETFSNIEVILDDIKQSIHEISQKYESIHISFMVSHKVFGDNLVIIDSKKEIKDTENYKDETKRCYNEIMKVIFDKYKNILFAHDIFIDNWFIFRGKIQIYSFKNEKINEYWLNLWKNEIE